MRVVANLPLFFLVAAASLRLDFLDPNQSSGKSSGSSIHISSSKETLISKPSKSSVNLIGLVNKLGSAKDQVRLVIIVGRFKV